MIRILAVVALLFLTCCSPLRSSPNDEKHQLELTLHAVQTNLDDVKHDLNCFQTELQILDGRIKYYENASSKPSDAEKQQEKLEQMAAQLQQLERKLAAFERAHLDMVKKFEDLSVHANETSAALIQFKERIGELEESSFAQNRKAAYKIYKVKQGDSLEKIAKAHQTTAHKIKKLNDLEQDLIVAGQQLKIPVE
jgi:LysM repeat protein